MKFFLVYVLYIPMNDTSTLIVKVQIANETGIVIVILNSWVYLKFIPNRNGVYIDHYGIRVAWADIRSRLLIWKKISHLRGSYYSAKFAQNVGVISDPSVS